MDLSDRAAAWATAYVLTNPDFSRTVIRAVSWAATLYPCVAAVIESEYGLPGHINMASERTDEVLDVVQQDAESSRNSPICPIGILPSKSAASTWKHR